MVELPTMAVAAHSHTIYDASNLHLPTSTFAGTTSTDIWKTTAIDDAVNQFTIGNARKLTLSNSTHTGAIEVAANVGRRLVQVFIADPDKRVPLKDSLLYRGEQQLTDLTDQELFFELDIKKLLDTHNEKRVKIVDKDIKDRTEYLEEVKIRDLKMVVTTVANF